MRPRSLLHSILLGATSLAACVQARINHGPSTVGTPADRFVGAWHLDSTKMSSEGGGRGSGRGSGGGTGGGLGMGPSPQTLVIRLGGTTMTVDSEHPRQHHVAFDVLLNGQKMANTIGSGDAARQGVYVSAWDGDRLVTTITAPAAKGSAAKVTYQDVRYIDNASSLVVDISIPGRPNSRHLVYTKSQ